jgi:hypothetical protein
MSVRVFWSPAPGTDRFVLDRGVTTASFAPVVVVTAAVPGPNYDLATGAYFYADSAGSTASFYRVAPIDTLGATGSYSDPFQVGTYYVGSLTTAAKVKEYLGIQSSGDDALIARLVAQSSRRFCSRVGYPVQRAFHVDTFDGDDLRDHICQHGPVLSVSSLTVDGSGVLARASTSGTGFYADGDGVHLSTDLRFTKGLGNCQVVYLAGYDPVPEDVEQAVIEHAALAYRSRTRIGIMNSSVGGENVSYQTTSIPFSIQSVIDAWTRSLV